MIYVFCPYGLISGGPDALHQLVYYLNKLNFGAKLVYCDIDKHSFSIPHCYSCYINDYEIIKEIRTGEKDILIFPETLWFLHESFLLGHKFLWWLSVDNNVKSGNLFAKLKIIFKKIFNKKQLQKFLHKKNKITYFKNFIKNKKFDFKNDIFEKHLCASYYAYNYVKENTTKNASLLIEPLSLVFLDKVEEKYSFDFLDCRSDIVLYNPAKNYQFTKGIIKSLKNKVIFKPISGYSQEELIKIYQNSKLYIDFGWFPGAERIPKEAVINGCAILTGKYGASGYDGDVPIPNNYKIEARNENIDLIKKTIIDMLNNYNTINADFDRYRSVVRSLEKNFISQITDIFGGFYGR